MNAEQIRLEEDRTQKRAWKRWGPYLSERQWGTVREDYSESGNAWDYFSHDQARSRAYRWGEDGLAGISDDKQLLCFSVALWNGKDPILKERMFGLTNSEANHGEDVKEYYFYLDSTPTHSYMKYLYKYPQSAYPYATLVDTNKKLTRHDFEYELLDTGVFDEDRYFDVFVEYAKASAEDILVQITVHNRGPEAAVLHVLPTVWFRNTWSWGGDAPRPELSQAGSGDAAHVAVSHPDLGERFLFAGGASELLFTENETNSERLFDSPNRTPFVKDGINNYIVGGQQDAVNPERKGTKASAHYPLTVGAGESRTLRLRLSDAAPPARSARSVIGSDFEAVMNARKQEADEFYASVIPSSLDADQANVMRQALAGMLWTKQFYHYDVDRWLEERGASPFKPQRHAPRNEHWHHMYNADIISMPDKWEYPWYAAWDLAFHVIALTLVDEDFGKQQLDLMLQSQYLHPNGQLPAYEWNFGDVNPPVHAWSTIFTYRLDELRRGRGDVEWLERSFHKLLLNFTWWVNRKDRSGRNVFEGGFLGLDNIGLDGAVLPEHARNRCGALQAPAGLRGKRPKVHRTLPVDRLVHGARRRRRRDVGRGGRVLLRRAAAPGWIGSASEGAFDGRTAAAVCRDSVRGRSARGIPGGEAGPRPVPQGAPGVESPHPRRHRERVRRTKARGDHDARQTAPRAGGDARRERVPQSSRYSRAFAPPPGAPLCVPVRGQGIRGRLPAGGVRQRHVRRQLQLARADLDAGQRTDHPGAAAVLRLLRERFHHRMPDGLGPSDESLSGG
jgi:hypothetical protein